MKLRLLVAGAVVAGALGIGSLTATAQNAVPTITVSSSTSATTLDNPGPIAAGPTRFNVTRTGREGANFYIGLLVPGVSVDELLATLRAEDGKDATSALGLVSIQGSVYVPANQPSRALTVTLKPGLTYVLLSEGDGNGKPPYPRSVTTLTTTGDANGATETAPDATVRMQGLRFKGASTLPRNGTVRFTNNDGTAHFAIAFPLRPGTTNAQFGRGIRGSERQLNRLLAGAPYSLQGIISGGNTADTTDVKFPKAGKYGLVCFIDEHALLGMYRVVTVR